MNLSKSGCASDFYVVSFLAFLRALMRHSGPDSATTLCLATIDVAPKKVQGGESLSRNMGMNAILTPYSQCLPRNRAQVFPSSDELHGRARYRFYAARSYRWCKPPSRT